MSEENKDILNKNEKKEKKGFFARLKEGLAKTLLMYLVLPT